MEMVLKIVEMAHRAALDRTARVLAGEEELPPGYMPPDEPIYSLPPDQREPELAFSAATLSEILVDQRDWSHTNLSIKPIHDLGIFGKGVRVVVCDTGVDANHPDLRKNVIPDLCRDWTGSSSGFNDVQGHGTFCVGQIGSVSDGNGMIGIAPLAEVGMQKCLGDNGSGASRWIANAGKNGIKLGADILSFSLGGSQPDPYTREMVEEALAANVWVVAAAGNDGGPANSYPGNYEGVLCVTATDRNDQRASFSTINKNNDVAAPGVSIMSTLPKGRYGTMSGTSMATPAVAGCLALYRGVLKDRGLRIPTMPELIKIIGRTAKDIAPAGPDSRTGSGLLAIGRMIAELSGGNPPPSPPAPVPTPEPGAYRHTITIEGVGTPPTITLT